MQRITKQTVCPKCGCKAITMEGRWCLRCGKFRSLSMFKRVNGMCDECRDEKQKLAADKRAKYFKWYYENVTKPKRRMKARRPIREMDYQRRLNEFRAAMAAFYPRPKRYDTSDPNWLDKLRVEHELDK